jgi:hypothetical protein
MKLRITGKSLRLRVTQSELAKLLDAGRIDETVYLGPGEDSRLTYALQHRVSAIYTSLHYEDHELTVLLSTAEVKTWAETSQVGIYASVDLGAQGGLDILVEKDFACLDLSDADNIDTFPNPNAGAVC